MYILEKLSKNAIVDASPVLEPQPVRPTALGILHLLEEIPMIDTTLIKISLLLVHEDFE